MNGEVEGGAEGVSLVKGAAGWGEGSSNPVGRPLMVKPEPALQ